MPHLLRHAGTLVAMLSALPSAVAAAERCATPAGRVAAVDERVEVAVGSNWTTLRLGEPVCVGDILRSGAGGRSALMLETGAVLRLAPGTTLRIEEARTGERTMLELIGGIASFFSRRPHALEVDTRYGNAAVEGTEFTVEALPDRSRVTVLEGRVRFSNPQGAVRLTAGEAAVAVAGRAPEIELRIRPRDAVQWALYYPPLPEADLPPDAPVPFREAARLAAEGRRSEALARLESVPVPARTTAFETLRAELLLGLGRVEETEAALSGALRRDPASADAFALRAVMAVARNRKDEALADARQAVALAPGKPRAQLALSYAAQAAFDIPLARNALELAARAAPDDALILARLAEIQLVEGDTRAAHRSAQRALKLDPRSARAQTVAGFVALTRIDTPAARAAFAQAIELDSLNPLPHLGRGLANIRDGDLESGRADLELAVTLDPDNALLRSYLGNTYLEEGRVVTAGEELATAKALDPNDPTPWLYSAIEKERDNRPVEALRDFERSIVLNDNRAPVRSGLLLDQDRAVRGALLGRIYQDLGFEALGAQAATRAVDDSPGSAVAHRFLAEIYTGRPRLELARASELLQAQLAQPLGASVARPSVAFIDLDLPPGLRSLTPGYSEYSDLFVRDGLEFLATGGLGSDETRLAEVGGTALIGRASLSAGYFHYETDGFRENFDLEHDIFAVLGQAELSKSLSTQIEYRRRDSPYGDSELRFDLDDFQETLRESLEEDLFRAGLRYAPDPAMTLFVSAAYVDREEAFERTDEVELIPGLVLPFDTESETSRDAYQVEAKLLRSLADSGLTAGFGFTDSDDDLRLTGGAFGLTEEQEALWAAEAYAGYSGDVWPGLRLDTRLGYDRVELNETDMAGLTPGLGLRWRPLSPLELRVVAARTIKRPYVVNQTLRDTQLAGFNLLYDDPDGTRADQFGLGAEWSIVDALSVGASAVRRHLAEEIITSDGHRLDDAREDTIEAHLSWTPTSRVAVSAIAERELYRRHERDTQDAEPQRTTTNTLGLSLAYFSPLGPFARVMARELLHELDTTGAQDVDAETRDDQGLLVDLVLGYRLPARQASIEFHAANLLDKRISFQDEAFRSNNEVNPRFIPSRTLLAVVTVKF